MFVCDNLSFQGEFTPVLAKHLKNFSIVDSLVIGVGTDSTEFRALRRQVETWRSSQISEVQAKLVIYRAFILKRIGVARSLARDAHQNYVERIKQSRHDAIVNGLGKVDIRLKTHT